MDNKNIMGALLVLWLISFVAWVCFLVNKMIPEMFLANAAMWIFIFARFEISKSDTK